ncbi:MAG: aldehyde dehydrogenase family protein [Gammaproteobacteria bacterium]|nr:aldehyde dehydrogenase family protein [Gammaproteobacteria bacterium]
MTTIYDNFIDGQWQKPASGKYMVVTNPATGEVVAEATEGGADDVNAAVSAARVAFDNPEWRDMPIAERSKLLYQLAQLIGANATELAELEVSSSGGTISRIMGLDIPLAMDLLMTLAEEVKQFPFVETLPPKPLPEPVHTQVWREAIGVCGLIIPWNFPLLLLLFKLAPALATGNTVVVKPSELTPTSTLRLAEIFSSILPAGVFNVVNGMGPEVGEAMSLHPDIDKISFTGSTAIGRRVQKNAAETLKRVTLELGGKGPAIVLPDADLERVAYGSLYGVLLNAGQACESGTRLLVHESIYEPLIERLVALSAQVPLGNPADPATGMGPMSSHTHGGKVLGYIESAREVGARIACGGNRVSVPGCEGGFFVEPTVIADVTNDMKVAREEIFGPVISVIKDKRVDDAFALAHDYDYGLSAGVWSEDVAGAQDIARKLRAGSIWINDWHMMRADAPFGGYKQSGYGREMGRYSLGSYLETKAVTTAFERDSGKKAMHNLVHKHIA